MTEFALYFSWHTRPELEKTIFSHPHYGSSRIAVRGKTGGAHPTPNTFQWTQAVVSLAKFFVCSRLYDICNSPRATSFLFEGGAGSAASSLDFSLSKAPQWLIDVFGCDSSGTPVLRRLIKRSNSERRRPGPVVLSLNEQQLPACSIRIYINGRECADREQLQRLANALPASPDAELPVANVHPTHPSFNAPKIGAAGPGALTEIILRDMDSHLHFRDEWLPIVNIVVADTKSVLRGTVLEHEVAAWWHTVPGQMYLSNNVQLLSRGVQVKRLFLFASSEKTVRTEALLNALVQERLGVHVRLADPEMIADKYGIREPMVSVHDDDFAAVHRPSAIVPSTEIETRGSAISKIAEFYDEVMDDDTVSAPLSSFLIRAGAQPELVAEASRRAKALRLYASDGSFSAFLTHCRNQASSGAIPR